MTTRASDVAAFLGTQLQGQDLSLDRPASLAHLEPRAMVFAASFSGALAATLNAAADIFVIASQDYVGRLGCAHVVVARPRLAYIRAVQRFFAPARRPAEVASTARIGKNVTLGEGVRIGEYAVIGDRVSIGAHTEVRHHAVLADGVVVGKHCVIKSHAVIGEEGFGFEYDESGVPLRFPHLGSVRIGDHVEVGSSTVIARGTLDDTVVEDHVKFDDKTFVAHNVVIGAGTLVTACAEISGSVRIGKRVWIGPNASVIDKVAIGDGAFIGIAAAVTKDVATQIAVGGNPAKVLGPRNR